MKFPTIHPIFRRETMAYLRSPWLRMALLLYLIVPFTLIAWKWPQGDELKVGWPGATFTRVYIPPGSSVGVAAAYGGNDLAEGAAHSFFLSQVALIALILPVMGAFSIAREKENRTYEFLFTTLLGTWTIGVSKFAAILVVGVALTAASMSALSFIFQLGGVESRGLMVLGELLLIEAVLVGSVSIFCSTFFKRGFAALVATYLWCLPILAVMFFLLELNHSITAMDPDRVLVLTSLTGILATLLMVGVAWRTRRAPEEGVRRDEKIAEDSALWTRRNQWPYYVVDPRRRPDPVADGANPIVAKERLTNLLYRSAWRWRCVYLVVGLVLGAICVVFTFEDLMDFWVMSSGLSSGPERLHSRACFIGIWLFTLVLAALWAVFTHAVAFAGEQDGGTIEMLKLSGLTPREFLRGKWLVCWRIRWPYALIMVAVFLFVEPWVGDAKASVQPLYYVGMAGTLAACLVFIEMCALMATAVALRVDGVRTTMVLSALLGALVFWRFPMFLLERGIPDTLHDMMDVGLLAGMYTVLAVFGLALVRSQLKELWEAKE